MPTKNIECQLAQGQIGRYLNGERFSPQAIKQLESHVADCDECSELVTRRRQALMTMVGEGSTHAAVMAPTASPLEATATPAKERLMSALSKAEANESRIDVPVTQEPTPSKLSLLAQAMNSKPLLYCAGLAAVLVAMSYFSRGALKTFGPTVESSPSIAAVTPSEVAARLPAKAISTAPHLPSPPAAVIPAPAAKVEPLKVQVKAKLTPTIAQEDPPRTTLHRAVSKHLRPRHLRRSKPHQTVSRRTLTRRTHRLARRFTPNPVVLSRTPITHHRFASPNHSTIRIYDAQGRALQD